MTTTGSPSSAARRAVSEASQSSSGRRWCESSRTNPALLRSCRRETSCPHRATRATEQRRVPLRDGPRALAIPRPEPPGQLSVTAPGQRDEALRVLREQRLREPGDAPSCPPGSPATRAGTGSASRSRHARAARGVARAGARRSPGGPPCGPRGGRAAGRAPGEDGRDGPPGREAPPGPPALVSPARPRAPRRHHDPARVRHRGVEQLDLDPDDRVQPSGLRGGREPDRAVEALVVRDREPGQAQLHGPRDEVVRRGRAVQEREVAVAVQLGVRECGHGAISGGGREG